MTGMARRAELADFLRTRRETLDPVSVGLQPGPRRRTPGLRREEVAQLSGVSHTWYTWLEQRRDITVSRQVLDSLARALRLSTVERRHLFALADVALPDERLARPVVTDTLRRLVDTLDPNPAHVISPWWDLLAWNRTYSALLGGLEHRAEEERNSLWLLFTDPATRSLLVDWNAEARQILGQFRANTATYPGDPRATALVDALDEASAEFRTLWAEHPVKGFQPSRKRFNHAIAGRLDLDYVKLTAAEDNQQNLVVFLPADPTTTDRLRQLSDPAVSDRVPLGGVPGVLEYAPSSNTHAASASSTPMPTST